MGHVHSEFLNRLKPEKVRKLLDFCMRLRNLVSFFCNNNIFVMK